MMDEFDKALGAEGKFTEGMHDALVEVADTLRMAVKIAKTRLSDNWTGADAIEICRLVLERYDGRERKDRQVMTSRPFP